MRTVISVASALLTAAPTQPLVVHLLLMATSFQATVGKASGYAT